MNELTNFRIVKDLGGSKSQEYHKERLYVILFERLPFDLDSRVYEFGDFEGLCKEFLKLSQEFKQE